MILRYIGVAIFLPLVRGGAIFSDHLRQSPLDEVTENTYLKAVFPGGEEKYVRNWECRDGIWTEDMSLKNPPNCICVKGVYAIGSQLCDDDFIILTGDGHCFDVQGRAVRKLIPLTGRLGLKGRANTVFRADAPYFARLNSPTPTSSVPEPVNYMFRMNDPADIAVYAKFKNGQAARLKCLLGQQVSSEPNITPVMQIVKLPDCANEFRSGEGKEWCDDNSNILEYRWTLNLGQSWSKNGEIGTGAVNSSACRAIGPPVPSKAPKGHVLAKGRRLPRAISRKSGRLSRIMGGRALQTQKPANTTEPSTPAQPKCKNFDPKVIELAEYDTNMEHFYQPDIKQERPFFPASFLQKEVNKQNRRVGHLLRKFFLGGDNRVQETPRMMESHEFKYVQLSKEILKGVCPAEYVPPAIVDLFIRAFRLLYMDSAPGYPYPIPFNEHENERIEAALTQCKEEAKPIAFLVNTTCPDVGFLAANQTLNATLYVVRNQTNRPTMPASVAFNVSSMDVTVELVWKITMLVHYYCTDKFIYIPFDFSMYFVKMEAFLKNPFMLFRWYHPGEFNRLLQIFALTNNLDKFAMGVDRCVEAAFASSSYKNWVTRPMDMMETINPKARKLDHDVGQQVKSPTGNFGKARRKRYYIQDDLWGKQAYCMRNTDAPYTEVRTNTFLSCKRKPIWFENTD